MADKPKNALVRDDGTIVTDTEPQSVAPAPAADPAEGQKDAANDEQLNENPQPVVAAGPDKGDEKPVTNKQGGVRGDVADGVRSSTNSVWCPNDGLASPRGTDACPACGFDFSTGKKGKSK